MISTETDIIVVIFILYVPGKRNLEDYTAVSASAAVSAVASSSSSSSSSSSCQARARTCVSVAAPVLDGISSGGRVKKKSKSAFSNNASDETILYRLKGNTSRSVAFHSTVSQNNALHTTLYRAVLHCLVV
jgi:acyl-coenzyme A synthetase/AMP-(fatty) acid ligase